MEIAYKDFHRKMAPFREESLEDILENQVNQWIKLNNIQVINVETLWERNSHVSVGLLTVKAFLLFSTFFLYDRIKVCDILLRVVKYLG
jgi:hypothetical protein